MSQPIAVPVEGGVLAAETWPGPGPAVVLLHAGVADRRSWYGVAAELKGRVRLIAYDRRGFGESAPGAGTFSHAGDLLAVLDTVNEDRVWLVGSSAGGGVALAATLLAPERVAGLILLAPGGLGSAPESELDPDTRRLDEHLDAATSDDEVNRLETWLWLDGPSAPEGRVGGEARALALAMNAVPLAHGVDDDAGASGVDIWARLHEIRVPAIVAAGDLDVPALVIRSRLLADRLSVPYVEWPGVAHLPYLEDPALVAGLIAETVGTPS